LTCDDFKISQASLESFLFSSTLLCRDTGPDTHFMHHFMNVGWFSPTWAASCAQTRIEPLDGSLRPYHFRSDNPWIKSLLALLYRENLPPFFHLFGILSCILQYSPYARNGYSMCWECPQAPPFFDTSFNSGCVFYYIEGSKKYLFDGTFTLGRRVDCRVLYIPFFKWVCCGRRGTWIHVLCRYIYQSPSCHVPSWCRKCKERTARSACSRRREWTRVRAELQMWTGTDRKGKQLRHSLWIVFRGTVLWYWGESIYHSFLQNGVSYYPMLWLVLFWRSLCFLCATKAAPPAAATAVTGPIKTRPAIPARAAAPPTTRRLLRAEWSGM